jgi:thiamine-monophosphate kinase
VTEDEIVAAIHAIALPTLNGKVRLSIGDDAALWQPSRSHYSAITTDALVEGVHFSRATMSLHEAGRRAMAANASDLAAMGARPVLATIALGLPAEAGLEDVAELYRGLAQTAGACGMAIVGGDLTRAPALTIAVTAVGEVRASNAKSRSGGRPGDAIAVTGVLGGSRAGLEIALEPGLLDGPLADEALSAFRTPQARCAEGRFLAASRNVGAMMDCSDGLSTDLDRLCRASDCGAVLDRVPVAGAARAIAQLRGEDPERFALAGGEDFELLVAVRPRAFEHLAARYRARFGSDLHRIGTLRAEPRIVWHGVPLERTGWEHFAR